MPRPLTLPVIALVMLAGCSREGPEDPAIASPGAGIPMGAIGAVGASFDAPTAAPTLGPAPRSKAGKPHGAAPPAPIPADPFESPPGDPAPAPPPIKGKPRAPKTPSPSETTL